MLKKKLENSLIYIDGRNGQNNGVLTYKKLHFNMWPIEFSKWDFFSMFVILEI